MLALYSNRFNSTIHLLTKRVGVQSEIPPIMELKGVQCEDYMLEASYIFIEIKS